MNYILDGKDQFLLKNEINRIKDSLGKGVEVVKINYQETSLDELLGQLGQVSLFSNVELIYLYNIDIAQDFKKEAELNKLCQYLDDPNPDKTLIIDISFYDVDGRSKILNSLKKNCKYIKVSTLTAQEFHSVVVNDLKAKKINLDYRTTEFLINRLPLDVANWKNELEKLSNYGKTIDIKAIEKLVPAAIFGQNSNDSFEFANAILKKDVKKTMEIYNNAKDQFKELYSMIGLVASQFRFLYQVKYLSSIGMSQRDIENRLNAKSYRITKVLEMTSMHSLSELEEILSKLSDLDCQIKLGTITDKLGFELFLIESTTSLRFNPQ